MALSDMAQAAIDSAADLIPDHHAASDSNTIGNGGLS